MPITQSRRHFLRTLSLAGAAGLVRVPPALAAEGSLETTTVRISKDLAICEAPLEIAEELLRAEGFTDVRYVDTSADDLSAAIADRKVDFALDFPVLFAPGIDAGKPVTVLAGVHVGCFELFAGNDIRTIANLKGKTVGCEIAPAALLRLMVAQVGLDPDKDIRWVTDPSVKPLELFVEGKIDAFLGFPPEPQELRARKTGHVILSTALDRPGRNISAAWCWATATTSANTRSQPSACCAPSSRRPISAPLSLRGSRGASSMAASPLAMTTLSKP